MGRMKLRRGWSPNDDALFKQLLADNLNTFRICQSLKRPEAAVRLRAKLLGLVLPRKKRTLQNPFGRTTRGEEQAL
jgi:hypothetical protein